MIERDRASANATAGFGHLELCAILMVNTMGIQWGDRADRANLLLHPRDQISPLSIGGEASGTD